MKFGLIPVNVGVNDPATMIGTAQMAEKLGYESIWTFEHAVVPNDYQSKYPYSADGKMGVAPEVNFVDPMVALSAIAAATETIRLGTGVNILPQANPLYVAKQAASIDFISGGRLELGLGIGWLREEFRAAGIPFEKRGARFDDYIQGMRKIWSGETVEHQSEFLDWTGFKSYPVPVQNPFPVVIGGDKGKAFERIARYGNGWYAPAPKPEVLADGIAKLDAACEAVGRDRSEIQISAMFSPRDDAAETIARFAEVGADRLIIPVFALGANPAEGLQRFAEEVIAKAA